MHTKQQLAERLFRENKITFDEMMVLLDYVTASPPIIWLPLNPASPYTIPAPPIYPYQVGDFPEQLKIIC